MPTVHIGYHKYHEGFNHAQDGHYITTQPTTMTRTFHSTQRVPHTLHHTGGAPVVHHNPHPQPQGYIHPTGYVHPHPPSHPHPPTHQYIQTNPHPQTNPQTPPQPNLQTQPNLQIYPNPPHYSTIPQRIVHANSTQNENNHNRNWRVVSRGHGNGSDVENQNGGHEDDYSGSEEEEEEGVYEEIGKTRTIPVQANVHPGNVHATQTHVHANGTHVHQNGTHVHQNGTHVHQNGTHVHQNGTHVHDNHVTSGHQHHHLTTTHVPTTTCAYKTSCWHNERQCDFNYERAYYCDNSGGHDCGMVLAIDKVPPIRKPKIPEMRTWKEFPPESPRTKVVKGAPMFRWDRHLGRTAKMEPTEELVPEIPEPERKSKKKRSKMNKNESVLEITLPEALKPRPPSAMKKQTAKENKAPKETLTELEKQLLKELEKATLSDSQKEIKKEKQQEKEEKQTVNIRKVLRMLKSRPVSANQNRAKVSRDRTSGSAKKEVKRSVRRKVEVMTKANSGVRAYPSKASPYNNDSKKDSPYRKTVATLKYNENGVVGISPSLMLDHITRSTFASKQRQQPSVYIKSTSDTMSETAVSNRKDSIESSDTRSYSSYKAIGSEYGSMKRGDYGSSKLSDRQKNECRRKSESESSSDDYSSSSFEESDTSDESKEDHRSRDSKSGSRDSKSGSRDDKSGSRDSKSGSRDNSKSGSKMAVLDMRPGSSMRFANGSNGAKRTITFEMDTVENDGYSSAFTDSDN